MRRYQVTITFLHDKHGIISRSYSPKLYAGPIDAAQDGHRLIHQDQGAAGRIVGLSVTEISDAKTIKLEHPTPTGRNGMSKPEIQTLSRPFSQNQPSTRYKS